MNTRNPRPTASRRPRLSRRLLLASAIVAVVTPVAVPATTATAAAGSVTKVVISGRVTDEITGRPISAACVGAQWSDGGAYGDCAWTDARGKYRLAVAVPDTAQPEQLVVAPGPEDEVHLARTVTLTPQDTRRLVADIALPQGGAFTGRALDPRGRPVAGICPSPRGIDLTGVAAPVPTCSDADGRWRLAGVPVGDVAVGLLGAGKHQGSYVPTATLLADAQRFTVVVGDETALPDTVLVPGATVQVRTNVGGRDNYLVLVPRQVTQDLVGARSTSAEDAALDGRNLRLTNVQADEYLVKVVSHPPVDACEWDPIEDGDDPGPQCSDRIWWAPGTTTAEEAVPVHVEARKTVSLNADL